MNEVYTSITASGLLAWLIYRLAGLAYSNRTAGLIAVLSGLGAATIARQTPAMLYFVALYAPIAITLPVMAVDNITRARGFALVRFQKWEIALFLILYLAYILSSIGFVGFDPYRLGYNPAWAGMVALVFIAYGAWRKNPILPLSAVFGQALWMSGIGSSNYFDHLVHFLLIPILVCSLFIPSRINA